MKYCDRTKKSESMHVIISVAAGSVLELIIVSSISTAGENDPHESDTLNGNDYGKLLLACKSRAGAGA